MYLEWALHKYFRLSRVIRPELEDGKTEWFLLRVKELARGCWKVRRSMEVLFGDGWDGEEEIENFLEDKDLMQQEDDDMDLMCDNDALP